MDSYSFLAISVLIIIIIALIFSMILMIRRWRGIEPPSNPAKLDVLVSLAAAKHKEASQASALLQEVVESMDVGIVLTKEGQIDSFNPMAVRLIPEIEQLIGKPLTSLPFDPDQKNIQHRGKVLQTTFMELTPPTGLMTIQDITESFNMASELKLKERFSLMGRLSGQMAHQLKTRLSVIAGRAQLLSLKLEDKNSQEAALIYQEARSLSQKIGHLLAFYKYQELQLQEIDLYSFLHYLITTLQKNASHTLTLNGPKDIIINTDPYLLESALYLIIQNGMEPEVEATCITLEIEQIEEMVKIIIQDDGKGIPEHIKEQIFDPFITTRENGLGLGLFMARELIDKLGGSLSLHENQRKGTCFEIQLPIGKKHEKDTGR